MRGGTAEHYCPVVAVVGLDEDCVALGIVARDVTEGVPKARGRELGDGAGGGHLGRERRFVDGLNGKMLMLGM